YGRGVSCWLARGECQGPAPVSAGEEPVGGSPARPGGNAADVEAGAAEGRLAILAHVGIDAGGLQAQLGGADGGDIAGRAGSDDDDVEMLAHDGFQAMTGNGDRVRAGAGAGGAVASAAASRRG